MIRCIMTRTNRFENNDIRIQCYVDKDTYDFLLSVVETMPKGQKTLSATLRSIIYYYELHYFNKGDTNENK